MKTRLSEKCFRQPFKNILIAIKKVTFVICIAESVYNGNTHTETRC